MIKNAAFNDVREELEEVKKQRDDLTIKNITLEKEIKKLKEKIEVLEEALAYISEDDRAF